MCAPTRGPGGRPGLGDRSTGAGLAYLAPFGYVERFGVSNPWSPANWPDELDVSQNGPSRPPAHGPGVILPTGQFGYVENRPTRTRPPAKAIQANWRGPSAISHVRLPAPWEAVGNLIGSDRSQLHLRATRVRRPSPSSPTGERRGRRDPGPARPGRAPAPLQAPGAAGALDGEVLTNKSSQGRADAQRLVATRLLDRVHDPLGHFSRLQRIYPRAR